MAAQSRTPPQALLVRLNGNNPLVDEIPDFATVAARRSPGLDDLALAMAAELRPVDAATALMELDRLGAELAQVAGGGPEEQAEACREVLGAQNGFAGDRERYDAPENSMLDVVLERRTGLPILLSIVYVESARRAGVALAGVGLPGHYVVGQFEADPPLLLDPFAGGARLEQPMESSPHVRPWGPHETALRMLNNVLASYTRRGDLGRAIRAAELRLALPLADSGRSALTAELTALRARLN
ncbi:MAG: transglutaminase-like domain-containing protein [Thermoleophilaceae bacterium]